MVGKKKSFDGVVAQCRRSAWRIVTKDCGLCRSLSARGTGGGTATATLTRDGTRRSQSQSGVPFNRQDISLHRSATETWRARHNLALSPWLPRPVVRLETSDTSLGRTGIPSCSTRHVGVRKNRHATGAVRLLHKTTLRRPRCAPRSPGSTKDRQCHSFLFRRRMSSAVPRLSLAMIGVRS